MTCHFSFSTAYVSLLGVSTKMSLAELRVGHCSLVGTNHMRGTNRLDWLCHRPLLKVSLSHHPLVVLFMNG